MVNTTKNNQTKNIMRYELSIDPVDVPAEAIELFKMNGEWDTNNQLAIGWLVQQIKERNTCITIDIFEDDAETE